MKISELLHYLLANRHTLTGDTIADCLDLAIIFDEHPYKPVQFETLAMRWGCSSKHNISLRLKRLKKAGLLDYEAGVPRYPGYLLTRVGPLPVRKRAEALSHE